MKREHNKLYIFLIYLVLSLTTIIAYEQVRLNDFINYDDDIYVTRNPQVKAGLTGESILWAFTTSHANNWHPLTWLSHIFDCQVFGFNAVWHHLTSLLFHILNTLLLFWVLRRMTGEIWPSAFVAAAFALHPLHVESVAWVAERKDVLSGFFWMLTMAAYVRYVERPGIGKYMQVVFALCLGLLAKPMLVTLPFVLLLLDYWPLCRLQWGHQSEALQQLQPVRVRHQKFSFWRLAGEKIPLFILAAVLIAITFTVQLSTKPATLPDNISTDIPVLRITSAPVVVRISNALVSYLNYMIKMFYPGRLAVLYPHPSDSLPTWQPIVSLMIFAGISAGVIYTARHRGYPVVGWLWYIGTLVPVIGLVQVGAQAMADRYTYIPLIGIFIIVAWGASEIGAKLRYRRIGFGVIAGAVLTVMLIYTRMQVRYWRDSLTLFRHALAVTENNFIMHNKYGTELLKIDRLDEAGKQFSAALQINPLYPEAHKNKGRVLLEQGKYDEAIAVFSDLLRARADWADVHYCLGVAYARKGQLDDALKQFEVTVQLTSNWPEAYHDLASVYLLLGKFDLAIQNYKEALQLNPDYPSAINNLRIALEAQSEINKSLKK